MSVCLCVCVFVCVCVGGCTCVCVCVCVWVGVRVCVCKLKHVGDTITDLTSDIAASNICLTMSFTTYTHVCTQRHSYQGDSIKKKNSYRVFNSTIIKYLCLNHINFM